MHSKAEGDISVYGGALVFAVDGAGRTARVLAEEKGLLDSEQSTGYDA